MSQGTAGSWWRSRLPDLSVAVSRFPLAVGLAALLTLYKLYHGDAIGDVELRVMAWLAASFLWVLSVDFYAESQGHRFGARGVLWLIGMAVLAVLIRLDWEIWLSIALLLGGLLLLVVLSGHLGRGETNASFWLFNHRLWLAALLAGVGACLFGAGLSIIAETLKFLFGLGLPRETHDYIWTVSLLFVAPVSLLAFAPRSFTDTITPREEGEFTLRAVSALVRFVLVPLLLVYTAILYAYAVKIALAWELPKGTLGAMVVGYLLVGAATLLLGYPSRETGGPHVRFFWRYWVWLAALPVVLLFIAVSRRIADYGLTESRYLIVLIGIWALILAGIRIWRGSDFDLRVVPGTLALLLLAASFGPGGALGFSVMSQTAELERILTEKGLLVDGKIVPRSEGDTGNALGDDAARVRGIEWYLNTHHGLGLLAPWFEGLPDNPFAAGKTPEETARGVLAALGLFGVDNSSAPEPVYLNHYSDTPIAFDVAKGGHLVGPFMSQGMVRIEPESVAVEGLGTVRLELAGNRITARLAQGGSVTFNTEDAVKEIKRKGWPKDPDHTPIALKGSGGGLDGTLLVDNMTGNYNEPEFRLLTIRFWLVLAPPA